MSMAQRLINRTGALARKIKRAAPGFENINEQTSVLARASGSQKLILSAQRQTDPSFGLALLAQKIEIAKLLAMDANLSRVADGIQDVMTIADTGVAQAQTITAVADVSGSLNSTWFSISSINALTKAQKNFYLWLDDGSGIDPAPVGKTAIHVVYSSGATASTLGGLIASALAALTNDFASAVNTSGAVAITNAKPGAVPAAADGTAPTGFTFATPSTAGVNSNLNNTYFFLNSGGNTDKYYVWFNVASLGTDPAPGGLTAIPVAISASSSANTVATAAGSAIALANSSADFSTMVTTNNVSITNLNSEPYTPASDHNTGFSFSDSAYILQALINNVGYSEILSFQTMADAPSGIEQVDTITCVADNDGSLNNRYFLINSANNDNQYYVWFNVAGGGLDPMVQGKTSLMISIYLNSSASVVATAVAAALTAANSSADFSASAASNVVTATLQSVGPANVPSNGSPQSGETGFSFAIATLGQLALSLAGKYFELNDSNGSIAVWYKVSGSGSAPGGFHRTLEVDISSLASAATVASATSAVLAADSMFLPSNANGSTLNAVSNQLGQFGLPNNGTSTFLMTELQKGTNNVANLLQIAPTDLAEVLSGELEGNFYTISAISGNLITFAEDSAGYAGEDDISLRFEMRTTKPVIQNVPSEQV